MGVAVADARVAIVGTGAVGASIGVDVARAGIDVTFIDQWPEHVEAIRARGARVVTPAEELTAAVRAVHLCEVATLREKTFDIVIVAVKAYDTRWACELVKPLVRPDGLVVGVQNGITLDDMAAIVGRSRTIGAVVEIAANLYTPGVVQRQTPASGTWFALGSYDDSASGREPEVATVLGEAGTVHITDDIRSSKWMKLVANAAEFLPSAIVNLPLADALRIPRMREVMDAAGSEALRTALALGHRIVPMFGHPGIENNSPERYSAALLDAILSDWTLPDTRVAPLQDWDKRRRSECNEINGVVLDEQERLGGRAPVNKLLVELAHRIESGELAPDPANADLIIGTGYDLIDAPIEHASRRLAGRA
jgi:2-dehydropantoate 2-reductase